MFTSKEYCYIINVTSLRISASTAFCQASTSLYSVKAQNWIIKVTLLVSNNFIFYNCLNLI